MTEQSIGTARLDVVVNKSTADADISALKRNVADLGKTSDDVTKKTEQNSSRQQAALKRQAETLGFTKEEMVRYRIETQTTGKVQQDLLAILDKSSARLRTTGVEFNKFGVSAKQQAAALRGVPAQITDIVTALGSGQRPLTVLLQQGGQLKDMFGGVVPAVRALGGAIAGLINPFTIFAGVAAAAFLAFKHGDDEMVGFRQALALTGNTAGVTANQLQAMAAAMDDGVTTQHAAAAALAEVTKSGKFTADQIRDVASAAVAMERATGQSIEQTVAAFAKLKDDPVKAVAELNDKYHFLTVAVYEQIRALQEQGREEDAVNLAIRESSKALNKRAEEVVANAGFMERAWHSLGAVVRQVWDDIRDAGRASSAVSDAQLKIQSARSQLLSNARILREHGAGFTPEQIAEFRRSTATLKKQIEDANKVIANDPGAKQAVQAAARSQAAALAISLKERADTYKTGLEKLQAEKIKAEGEVSKAVAAATAAGDQRALQLARDSGKKILSELDKQIAEAQKRVATTGGGGGGGRGHSTGGRASAARDTSEEDAKRSARELLQQQGAIADAQAAFHDHLLDMQADMAGPLAQVNRAYEKQMSDLTLAFNEGKVALDDYAKAQDLLKEKRDQDAKAIEAQSDPMKLLLDDMKFELDMLGKSNAERAVMIELRRQNIDAMSNEGKAALETAKQFDEEAKAKQRSIDLMDDFRHGAADALTDFVTGAKSAKDAIKDFFNELAQRLIQMAAERLVEKAFGSFGTSGQSSGNATGNLLGAFFSALASAKGNVFENGQHVQAFANGGIVGGPTMFPMRNNRMGLMGEAGPEAIMPLKRGPGGRLGVEVTSANQQPVVNNVTTFYVPDLSSRRNQQQVADRTQRIQSKSTARNR